VAISKIHTPKFYHLKIFGDLHKHNVPYYVTPQDDDDDDDDDDDVFVSINGRV
jgi:hypothetical protein